MYLYLYLYLYLNLYLYLKGGQRVRLDFEAFVKCCPAHLVERVQILEERLPSRRDTLSGTIVAGKWELGDHLPLSVIFTTFCFSLRPLNVKCLTLAFLSYTMWLAFSKNGNLRFKPDIYDSSHFFRQNIWGECLVQFHLQYIFWPR